MDMETPPIQETLGEEILGEADFFEQLLRVPSGSDNCADFEAAEALDLFEVGGPPPSRERIARAIAGTSAGSTRRYIHTVYVGGPSITLGDIYAALVRGGEKYTGGFYIIADHGDHIHSIHDCSYSTRSCRCSAFEDPALKASIRKLVRRRPFVSELTLDDWERIILYLSTGGRVYIH